VLSTERMRHSRQKTCPHGVVIGNHSKLKQIIVFVFEEKTIYLLYTYWTIEIS